MENAVEYFGAQAEEGEKRQCLKKAFGRQIRFLAEDDDTSHKDEH